MLPTDVAVTVPPASEPVSLAEVKAHIRILHDTEDAPIGLFAKAARQHVERILSRSLITQTRRAWLAAWPRDGRIVLPYPPLQSVTSVKYIDADGAEQTLASDQYHVVPDLFEARIEKRARATWPRLSDHPRAVVVEYVAGYGAGSSAVPEDIRNAILLMAEHLYFNRGETSETNLVRNPVAAEALLGPHMTHGWI